MIIARWAHRRPWHLAALLVAGGIFGALIAGETWGPMAAGYGASAGILLVVYGLIALSR